MSLAIKGMHNLGFPGGSDGKESADNEGDLVSIPESPFGFAFPCELGPRGPPQLRGNSP